MSKLNEINQSFAGSDQVLGLYRGPAFIWGPLNKATGGSVSDFTDSSGKSMRVHVFSSAGNSTLNIEIGVQPFRVAAVAGGYNSARFAPGSRGRTTYSNNVTLPAGSYTITVGNPDGGWSGIQGNIGISGGAGGAGDQIPNIFHSGNWQSGGAGGPCCPGGGYPRGGGNSGNSERSPGTFYGAGGGAGEAVDPVWQPGHRGIVAVAYERQPNSMRLSRTYDWQQAPDELDEVIADVLGDT